MQQVDKCVGCEGRGFVKISAPDIPPHERNIRCHWCKGTGVEIYYTGDFAKEERREYLKEEYDKGRELDERMREQQLWKEQTDS